MKRVLLSVLIAAVGTCAWCQNISDAITVTQTAEDDYSYLLEGEGVAFTFEDNYVHMTVDGRDEKDFTLSETVAITVCPAHAFKVKAYQDPEHTENYYSTFFTSDGAYKVPSEAMAYIGALGKSGTDDVLQLTDVGNIIHQGEAVILKASQSDITLMPSCNKATASTGNVLKGTDEAIDALGANDYALSLGQNGVGFYQWNGKAIGANKAYLTLSGSGAKAFTFMFEDGTSTAIEQPTFNGQPSGDAYNLHGMRVNDTYRGIVIKNGKKIYQK